MCPILYTFRRCPYAIRARLALEISGVTVELREVMLKNKPQAMLDCSAKGTVPVLVMADGSVLDESYDIMNWALNINDPKQWLGADNIALVDMQSLIDENDGEFKYYLDRYKYANHYPQNTMEFYREKGEKFLCKLNDILSDQTYLNCDSIRLVDMAILPFVRQFVHVDKEWFYNTPYVFLQKWLDEFLASELFQAVMKKYKPWNSENEIIKRN